MFQDGELKIRNRKTGKEETYVYGVCLINTKHPNGAPALCTFILNDQTIDLAGGEEFMVCWVPKTMFPSR